MWWAYTQGFLYFGGGGLIFVGLRYNVLKCNENAMCINMQHL
jgi:hypothetical protein